MVEVLADGRAVGVSDIAAEVGENPFIHLVLPEITECLDDGAAFAARGGHVARDGVLEEDFTLADLNLAGRPSVRKTMRDGTCSERPSTLAA